MKEIERKFIVISESYKAEAVRHYEISQWYLNRDKERTVRVRIRDDKAFLTVKGPNTGIVRDEYEYEIPYGDAVSMKSLADGMVIEKTRWIAEVEGHRWEIDEFHGDLQGLTLAEIELEKSDETFTKPIYIGDEVSGDSRYFNSSLASGSLPESRS